MISETFAVEFSQSIRNGYRVPIATYRVQMEPNFPFENAQSIIPYLTRMGWSDLYIAPFFRAKPGSTHGYDVCDFSQINPELGGPDALRSLVQELQNHQMGLLLDFVPNHMAVEPVLNPWWRDMLEHGQSSRFAKFFDIDWKPVKAELRGKILLPFLGDHYGAVLDRGELVLAYTSGELVVNYFETTRPLDPKCYPQVFRRNLASLQQELGSEDSSLQEFLSILTALDHLPSARETNPERIAERLRESRFAKERLVRLCDSAPRIRTYLDEAIATFNGSPEDPRSFDDLHELLETQSYRLSYWKTAAHEINYRRFFDINQLAGLRVEEPAAFAAMHGLVLQLIRDGMVTGIRLDHIDGLFDPAGYLERLQSAIFEQRMARMLPADTKPTSGISAALAELRQKERVADPQGPFERPLFVVIEKILSGNESLPAWPMEGTTGYEFMNDVSRLFVNPRHARVMRKDYERFTGRLDPFTEVVYDCKN